MQAVFKAELNETEITDIKKFCAGVDYFAIEQSIGFTRTLYGAGITYFYLSDENVIKSFCQINENFRFAHVWFGPVCNDRELMVRSVNEIINYYERRGFWYLGVQMYQKTGYDCDYIEYTLNKSHKIKYIFDNSNTKSSLEINLESSLDEIYRNIRKGHKSDIKKAINSGTIVEEARDDADLQDFIIVYRKMCNTRKIIGHSSAEVEGICNYIVQNRMGQILVARDATNQVIGGAILAYQGLSVRYLLSASNPEKRELPMTHLIIYRALERAKSDNFKYFDFWGYNHFANKEDQSFNINSFKKGFGGYFTFFAKKMNISLVPLGYNIYRLSGFMKKSFKRFV